jgi:hypothetical protein
MEKIVGISNILHGRPQEKEKKIEHSLMTKTPHSNQILNPDLWEVFHHKSHMKGDGKKPRS